MESDSRNQIMVVDAHSDYPIQILRERHEGRTRVMERLHLPNLRAGGVVMETAVIGGDFIIAGIDFRDPAIVLETLDAVYEDMSESPGLFRLITSADDLDMVGKDDKINLMLTIEGSAAIGDNLSMLRNLYRLGLRSLSLTHNPRNILADGYTEGPHAGLSYYGRALVQEATDLNMIIDLVHINERGFYDILDLTEQPVVVSHSNARSLCDHPRNLTDEQIKAVADRGGVVALNFMAYTIDLDVTNATLGKLLNHADHIVDLCGVNALGAGPDFVDYFIELLIEDCKRAGEPVEMAGYVQGIENIGKMGVFIDGPSSRGYSDTDIQKIMGGNVLDLYKRILGHDH